ncbi:oligosaccharide flippase family protein [Liquorilactobacillus satsumensis]|uniref:Polysaccharide transporter n=1 Tax=Liquorilactobacillus satsumensis DSM 16230 = JCM 12392 TaxID=1423801 RepID=A0A0R1VDW4_9LACO|nr:oligosaccharide flippase family protein [Liquorilactobacillus satsumensis]KRM00028.1 polysaccharide transporter [Liquorilactobacillus satsumensis DSM 16230 = JCM 12392]
MKKPTENLFKGAAVLTLAALVAKILSALYRVPFENLVGNTGFYIYQQIYPFYGIAVTFSLTGFPVYISKLISTCTTDEAREKNAYHLFLLLAVFGLGVFGLLQLLAPDLSQLMGDRLLAPLIRSVSWSYLLVPFLAVGRGYKQGILEVVPTALSQLIEQTIRVIIIVGVAVGATHAGWSLYRIGSWSLFAGAIGAFCALLFFKDFFSQLLRLKVPLETTLFKKLLRGLFSEGLVICLYSALLVLLQLIDSFTLKNALEAAGNNPALAKSLKGVYDRAQPLLQLGLVLSLSFSASLMPLLSRKSIRHTAEYQQTLELAFRICATVATAASVGMFVLMPAINEALFGNRQGTWALGVAAFSVIAASLIILMNSVLQSRGQYVKTIGTLILIVSLKAATNYLFVYWWGLSGASFSSVLSLSGGLLFSRLMLSSEGLRDFLSVAFCGRIFICLAFLALSAWGLAAGAAVFLGDGRWASFMQCVLGAAGGAGVFALLARKLQLFSTAEWLEFPGGRIIVKLFK